MLYILNGQDDFSLRQSLEEIKRSIGDPELLATNTTTLDGQQLTIDQLRPVCETLPFLAEKRLVIVSGLLERFEPRGKAGRKKKTTQATNQQNGYKSFNDYVVKIPENTVLVLIDGRIGNSNPLLRGLLDKAVVKVFPPLRDAKLRQWIQKQVADEDGSISPEATGLLANLVGGNLWLMSNEIAKLVSFAADRRIEEEDVKAVVSSAQEASVFAMVDAILEFKAGVAEQLLQQLLKRGAAPAYLLVMLSRQIRMIVRAKELRSRGKPDMEIQNRLGLTSDFALRKTLEQAGRYQWGRIKEVYNNLLEADLAIKTGKYDGELALNIQIAEICQLGKT
ncbi:DNA polymerase III subunit delta [Chloroflexota bacterium]